jgi:integrase
MKAWLFQDSRQKQKLGDKCPWSVGWFDADGKKRSKRVGSKSNAVKYQRKVEGQLAAGTYNSNANKTWKSFREEYDRRILAGMPPSSREQRQIALKHFERIIKPVKLSAIKTQTIDDYIAARRLERGRKKGSTVSPASINKELRELRAVIYMARDWEYITKTPKFHFVVESEREPTFVPPEHFAAIYDACDSARLPADLPYPAADWWRALLCFTYMTGWRVSEPMLLKREELDLDAGRVTLRAANTKGRRGEIVPLHPVVVEHLRTIVNFEPSVFPWNYNRRTLWSEFLRIQEAAGINLPCLEDHEHTPSCYVYGFHDLRRAFATANAANLDADELQRLMRHRCFTTTQRYVNMAQRVNAAVGKLAVPARLQKVGG